ncbi:MAG: 4-hydroxy-3-methylbut-2-enyl diphosphate reductase [Candidatus Omnitrophica bacterium]|nr:4-hydroxy-3-methylbut-2-enyl diphosphate reductase [Candidatus Omnitrophota bacterium]
MAANLISEVPIYRKGFGLKQEVAGELEQDYHCELIDHLQRHDFHLKLPQVEVFLAREFGFCYGVDRAVDYAYETRKKFPERRLFLTTEIIHNPRVNTRLIEMGVQFLSGQYASGVKIGDLKPEDVVLLPAFGVSTHELKALEKTGCVLVDTTCGSVANVWRRVERYAREGYTSVVHGKYNHEETIATCSRAESQPGSKYLVVRDLNEADYVCDFIRHGGDSKEFKSKFEKAASQGFDPNLHLRKIGVANQTTMLSSESLEIARRIKVALADRYGEDDLGNRFLSFDTICSATQERQDAVIDMVKNPLDLVLIVGGFNSSNTSHLREISGEKYPAYHIDRLSRIQGSDLIEHRDPETGDLVQTKDWLPKEFCRIGFTAGASTPNQVIGEVIQKVLEIKGVDVLALAQSMTGQPPSRETVE